MLHAEDVDLALLANEVGTPFYCYSTATLERHYRAFADAVPKDSLIAFSVKANGNLGVLKTLARLGSGADVVSGGELKKALAAGIPAECIVFSGVGKTKAEMALGLDAGIHQFNVESEPELAALNETALAKGRRASVTLRINPDVDAKTHAKITTGTAENKFGVPIARARDVYAAAAQMKGIEIVGVDVHIGSQVTDLAPFEAAFARIVELARLLRSDGHNIARLDLGGGLGVPYAKDNSPPPGPAAYGALAERLTRGLGARLIFEPGGSSRPMPASWLRASSCETRRDQGILDSRRGDERSAASRALRRPSRDRVRGGACVRSAARPLRRRRADLRIHRRLRAGPRDDGVGIGRSCRVP